MIRLDETKMSKSVGNIFLLHQALDAYGRDALIMYFVGSDYRKPVEFDDERLDEAGARVERFREAARRLVPGPSPEWSAPLHERFFDALADDFKTPEALAAAFEWVREANRSEAGAGDADLREMLSVLGLDNLLDVAEADAPAEVVELVRRARTGPCGPRLRRGRPPARARSARTAGTSATVPTGPSCSLLPERGPARAAEGTVHGLGASRPRTEGRRVRRPAHGTRRGTPPQPLDIRAVLCHPAPREITVE